MAATLTKAQANYVDKSKTSDRYCGICSMYVKGGSCTLVKGFISPAGDCKHFERKGKGK